MEIDHNKIDEAMLVLLYLTLHDGDRAWKLHNLDTMSRLCEKGWINHPANKVKSVVLTENGLQESERLFHQLFAKR